MSSGKELKEMFEECKDFVSKKLLSCYDTYMERRSLLSEMGKLKFLSDYSLCVDLIEETENKFDEAYANDDLDEMEVIIADNFDEVYEILKNYVIET